MLMIPRDSRRGVAARRGWLGVDPWPATSEGSEKTTRVGSWGRSEALLITAAMGDWTCAAQLRGVTGQGLY